MNFMNFTNNIDTKLAQGVYEFTSNNLLASLCISNDKWYLIHTYTLVIANPM